MLRRSHRPRKLTQKAAAAAASNSARAPDRPKAAISSKKDASDDDWSSIADGDAGCNMNDVGYQPDRQPPVSQGIGEDITSILQRLHLASGPSKVPAGTAAPPILTSPNDTHFGAIDPMIYLTGAASTTRPLDICDFVYVSNPVTIEWEECKDTADALEQFVKAKSGARRPKLDNLTIAQWGMANTRIMDRLFPQFNAATRQYMAYTCKVFELFQVYDRLRVLQYDRRYRAMQTMCKFPWGTDLPHLDTLLLATPPSKPSTGSPGQSAGSEKTPTKKGTAVCDMYNAVKGCKFGMRCNFKHECSKCHGPHPAFTHKEGDSKAPQSHQ